VKLEDSVAVVTGAAQNIGLGIATALAERGSRVVGLDLNAEALAQVSGERFWGIPCDVADPAAVAAAVEAVVARFGRIDVLVNAAGWICSAPLFNVLSRESGGRHDLALWEKALRLNLTSAFVMTSHVVERMVRSRTRGLIVNISSVVAGGNPGQSAYAAAKAGVNALAITWARELGAFGIRALAIAPGFIDTPSTRQGLSPERLDDWVQKTPLRRLGTVDEVARAVLYAVENDYVTGTVLEVAGGLTV
jgi:3-oxoacyl-[acyl-carrier protein] reductase